MKTPRTLHLTVRRVGGGTETNVRNLCAAVPEFEHAALEDWMGPGLSPHRIVLAARALRRLPHQVIFCYGVTAHLAAHLAWPIGKPLVGNIRCETDFVGWKDVWQHLFGARFRPWISNSRMALRGGEGMVIYNGVSEPRPERPLYPNMARPTFGILASGHPKKGHRFAMELWRKLGKPGSMIFAGNLGDELRVEAEREGILCPGFVEPGPLLRSLDLLLVPSTAEGLPTVLLEAMIRRVPCLATPVGGIPELIRHGENGYMLPREEWEEFLRTADPAQWVEAGLRGQAEVRRRFSFERMVRRFRAAAWMSVNQR